MHCQGTEQEGARHTVLNPEPADVRLGQIILVQEGAFLGLFTNITDPNHECDQRAGRGRCGMQRTNACIPLSSGGTYYCHV